MPQALDRPRTDEDLVVAQAAISGSTAAVPICPSASEASRRIRSLLSPSKGIRSGTAGAGVGPDPTQGHDDLRSDALFPLLQQAAQALDRRFADGRQRQGGPIVLVRLFLLAGLRSWSAAYARARGPPTPRRAPAR